MDTIAGTVQSRSLLANNSPLGSVDAINASGMNIGPQPVYDPETLFLRRRRDDKPASALLLPPPLTGPAVESIDMSMG